jgi:DNA-binding CsgD family transcriptional regulator
MQVNENVMPSDTGSRTLRHYGEFQMIIDVVVPARTPQMDYLHHPECDASTVADMIRAGKSASEIARALGVSRFKVGKVTEFLDTAPNPLRLDYLNHPRCPAETTMQLRSAGHTFEEIGERLGISHELIRKVLRTYSKAKNIPMLPAKAHRGQRKSCRARAATERIAEHSVQP